ncbi:hypothetical protein [Cyclobacterium qasimii]|uniref:Uncharacterized protein n=2 Tax=Cyclobacterium qasimii TaxID=1350429 RepID=S7WVN8_9BACT|nr:hypothetical protein [Cyclobacterium qasimii]EPR68133.1 hypothetical protein ADICYQ_2853 [Cyclobacterium qasimii M12-11B]GEO19973.1 hypothetical protein CQA01_05070 [Cyclobacterium qasimii]
MIIYFFVGMGEAYQIRDQELTYILTFQVIGWAAVFTRKRYSDFILENLTWCRKEKGLLKWITY